MKPKVWRDDDGWYAAGTGPFATWQYAQAFVHQGYIARAADARIARCQQWAVEQSAV